MYWAVVGSLEPTRQAKVVVLRKEWPITEKALLPPILPGIFDGTVRKSSISSS